MLLLSRARQLGHNFIGFVCFVNIWMEDREWMRLYKVCCSKLCLYFDVRLLYYISHNVQRSSYDYAFICKNPNRLIRNTCNECDSYIIIYMFQKLPNHIFGHFVHLCIVLGCHLIYLFVTILVSPLWSISLLNFLYDFRVYYT